MSRVDSIKSSFIQPYPVLSVMNAKASKTQSLFFSNSGSARKYEEVEANSWRLMVGESAVGVRGEDDRKS